MNYQKIYNQIIERAKNRKLKGYKERHHIIPKCIGGSNKKDNIVELTAREHFVCHHLLTKIYPKNPKLWYALDAMVTLSKKENTRYTPSSREVSKIKEQTSKLKKSSCWVHKNGTIKKIHINQLSLYENDGWIRGRGVSYIEGKIAVVFEGKTSYILKKDLQDFLDKGYELGNSQKGKKLPKSSTMLSGRVCINNGKETKRVHRSELTNYIELGWQRGYHYNIDYSKRNLNSLKNRVCVWKNGKERRIPAENLDSFLNTGWQRGHLPLTLDNKDIEK